MKNQATTNPSSSQFAAGGAPPRDGAASRGTIRCTAFALMVLPLTLLATAGHLEPSPTGLGTHQQLGLPPCTMRMLVGIRCPGCGMTTSWSHFTHGQWHQSWSANLGGFLLAIYSLGFASVCGRVAFTGQMPSHDLQRMLSLALIGVGAVTLVAWGCRFAF